jgi:5-methylcytosine-specific restriction endonuclease McrA
MDNQRLLFPKTDKEQKPKRDRRAFQELIIGIDRRCMNSLCEWHRKPTEALAGHHILFSGQGGSDTASNGITLCRRCHDLVHGIGTGTLTGDEEMLKILTRWLFTDVWRWDESYEWVKRRAEKHRGGTG